MASKKVIKDGRMLSHIRDMKVGETLQYPIEKLLSIRPTVSNANLMYGGKRTTRTDRIKRVVYITRES